MEANERGSPERVGPAGLARIGGAVVRMAWWAILGPIMLCVVCSGFGYVVMESIVREPTPLRTYQPEPEVTRDVTDWPVPDSGDRPPYVGPVSQYSNCAQAAADHRTPLRRGDAGWNPDLDRDGDGVACVGP